MPTSIRHFRRPDKPSPRGSGLSTPCLITTACASAINFDFSSITPFILCFVVAFLTILTHLVKQILHVLLLSTSTISVLLRIKLLIRLLTIRTVLRLLLW